MAVQSDDQVLGDAEMGKKLNVLESPRDAEVAYLMGFKREEIVALEGYLSGDGAFIASRSVNGTAFGRCRSCSAAGLRDLSRAAPIERP